MEDRRSDPMTRDEMLEKAGKISPEDIELILEKADEIERKASRGPLDSLLGEIRLLISMLRDYTSRRYRTPPLWMVGAAAVALLYVLNPMDVVPDIIPALGYVDDAFVVGLCLNMLRKDLRKYESWKRSGGRI